MDPVKDREKIEGIVNKLCDDYKSHAYQISRREAREIGLNAVDATPEVDSAMMSLLKFYMARSTGQPPRLTAGNSFKMYIAWLDSVDLQMRVEADAQVVQGNELKMLGDKWMTY